MKTTGVLLLFVLALSAAGCGETSVPSAGEASRAGSPASTAGKPQFSYINTGDVRAKPQLLSGWYPIEDGAWRWMGKEAQAVLLTPQESPVSFELRLFFPENHMKRAGGPVTVSVLLDGTLFAQETFSKPGNQAIHKPVPAGTLAMPATQVTLRLDRTVPPADVDKRELGAVIQGFGFLK